MTATPESPSSRGRVIAVAVGLGLLTFLAFFGVWNNGFVDYDDNHYVFRNPFISRGLDWRTVTWAFGYVNSCHWLPLTWISHALDCEMYGLNPAGHHINSLLLHTTNVVLLFLALRLMTGSLWRSALVAALFGVHPLRVESVAWVAERKDVLSGLFFMLTLIGYVRFVRFTAPDPQVAHGGKRFWYIASLGFFAMGLLSKTMLVTTPFLLLLLDYWPLRRVEFTKLTTQLPVLKKLVWEKIPFFGLTALFSGITYLLQDRTITEGSTWPASQRLANGVLACVTYLQQTFWPANLSVYYPLLPARLSQVGPLIALAGLLVLTLLVVIRARRHPELFTGWFWYLGMLVPVSGLVQVGSMVQADHFTYLPSIGLFILLAWNFGTLVAWQPRLRLPLAAAVCLCLGMLTLASYRQIAVWRNTETLFVQAASATRDNHVALTSLAGLDLDHGRIPEAVTKLEQALQAFPHFQRAEYLMGAALQMQGKMAEALPHLQYATGLEVSIPGKARTVLSLLDANRLPEADALLEEIARTVPGNPDVGLMKAIQLRKQGRTTEAEQLFRQISAVYTPMPQDTALLNFELAEFYSQIGDNRKAVTYYAKAVELSPQHTNALNNYAWVLATAGDSAVRNGARAVELAERACQLTGWKVSYFMGNLAAAYAEAGRFAEAVKMAEKARDQAEADKLDAVAKSNAKLLELYRQGKPYHESAN